MMDLAKLELYNFERSVKKTKFAKSVILVNFFSAAGFFITFLFQIVFAKEFGVSALTDSFIGVSALPLTFVAVISSLLEKTFIPIFFEYKKENTAIWYGISNFFGVYFLFLVSAALLVYTGSPFITRLILSGFKGDSFSLALTMLRVLLPILIIGGLIGLLTSLHYAHGSFIFPNVSSSLKWTVSIVAMLLLKDKYGIFSVPFSIIIGYVLQLSMLLYSGFKNIIIDLRFVFNLKDKFLQKIVALMWPLVIANFFNNISILLMTRMASVMNEGSITCLDYAYKIMTIGVFLCVQGISVVLFPIFSHCAASDNMPKLKKMYINSQRILLMIVLPAIAGLIIFRYSVVKILFEHGKFSPAATYRIGGLVFCFSGAFLGLALGTIQSQIYYAFKNTRRVMFITFIQMMLFALMVLFLRNFMSAYFIAVAFSIAIFSGCCLNYIHINKILGISNVLEEFIFVLKISAATLIMGFSAYLIFNAAKACVQPLLVSFIAGSVLSLGIYFILLKYVFNLPELKLTFDILFSRKHE